MGMLHRDIFNVNVEYHITSMEVLDIKWKISEHPERYHNGSFIYTVQFCQMYEQKLFFRYTRLPFSFVRGSSEDHILLLCQVVISSDHKTQRTWNEMQVSSLIRTLGSANSMSKGTLMTHDQKKIYKVMSAKGILRKCQRYNIEKLDAESLYPNTGYEMLQFSISLGQILLDHSS